MNSLPAYTQTLTECHEVAKVGGKAVNLGKLIRAGFPVPPGFVITTRAYKAARANSAGNGHTLLPDDVADEIRAAYRAMGGGIVAVRSSATAEDMGSASMAGQYETFLNIDGEQNVLDAVQRCWASLDAPRTRAYLKEHGIEFASVAMAVVVQRLVASDVAGVLFTTNPGSNGHREMLLEASWGLGECVVSGRVQPDILRLDQDTQRVIEATIADKQVYLAPGDPHERPVEEFRRRQPCLKGRDVYRLWQLGRRAAEYFGSPQDIEWAIERDEVFMVQSRPITTQQEAESYEEMLRSTRQHLRAEFEASRGPWVLHNLAETLPHPTPLTWSVIKRFMSGSGGFGAMYREAGFEPSPAVDRDGFLERIGGRVYMDVCRAPEMFFEDFPFAYDLNALKTSPEASQAPPTLPRGSIASRLKCARKLGAVNAQLRELSKTLDAWLRDELFPEINGYVSRSKPIDLSTVSVEWLLNLWSQHEQMVLGSFSPKTLLPGLVCGMAMADLRTFLNEHFWDEDVDAMAQLLSAGGAPSGTVIADAELYEVAKGTRTIEAWLDRHGHRGAGELDLASPRWREQPPSIREMASRMAGGEDPLLRHQRTGEEVARRLAEIESRLSRNDRSELHRHIELVRRYVAFREDGKNYLMLGYDLLRDVALEAGRRLGIGEDIFYLTREDLFDSLGVGFAPHHLIEKRKAVFRAESRLSLPHVIDSDAVETLGHPSKIASTQGGHKAFAISAGESTGPAKILHSPTEAGDLGHGYILVCPSTDPSWTPLFVNAAGLVLECGGTLSHGAVVAREMGLPAVVLPDAARIFSDGEEIRIDARRGWVGPATAGASNDTAEVDESIPRNRIPPPPGPKDRTAAKARNVMAIFWTVFLLGFFLLPPRWVHQPAMAAMDFVLWPIARLLGKPAVVATVAVGLALITLLVQKFATDNDRLLLAKRRAAALKKEAESLPANSPKRTAMLQLAAPVQSRIFMAAMVPIGILLGPMVMPFVWFHERIDPSTWNALAGSAVQIIATVDSNWNEPVTIKVPEAVRIDEGTPALRKLPPLRQTLERLLTLYRQPRTDPTQPWELQLAPDLARQQTADDLQTYLNDGIPPQGITWMLRTAEGFDGRFPVTVSAGVQPVTVNVVLGEHFPPAPTRVAGIAGSPLKEVRIAYAKSKQEPIFWRPFGSFDVGWLWFYIIVYLPALFLLRAILRIV